MPTIMSAPVYEPKAMPGAGGASSVTPEIKPEVKPEAKFSVPSDPKKSQSSLNSDRAQLIVAVPADAKLFIDDQLIKATAGERIFNTPSLERGEKYYYEVRIEMIRDGKTISKTEKVIVEAGRSARASFLNMERGVIASK